MRWRAPLLAVIVGLLAGCGSDSPEDTVRSFLTEPDCDHVTDAYLRYKRGVSQQSRDEHCEAFRKRVKPVDEDKIGSVKVKSKEGDRAVVLATAKESGDAGALFTLRRQDGEWRIDSGPRPYVEPE